MPARQQPPQHQPQLRHQSRRRRDPERSGSGNTNTVTRTVIVRDPVPIISGVVVGGSGGVILNLGGTPERQYILETTEEFFPAIWLPVATNTLDARGTWQFTDLQVTNFPQRFYRLKLVP